MKTFAPLLLSFFLILSGCGKPAPQPQPIFSQPSLAELVDALVEDYVLPMPAILDDELITGLFGVETDDIVQYRGYISMSSDACDQIVGIEANDGKVKTVAEKLDARLAFIMEDAKSGGEPKRQKAEAGACLTKGSYVFLIVAGRPDTIPADEVSEIVKRIEDNFSKTS